MFFVLVESALAGPCLDGSSAYGPRVWSSVGYAVRVALIEPPGNHIHTIIDCLGLARLMLILSQPEDLNFNFVHV
jgi:hypothetical protein